jgi:tRNA pseudouridine65 synthase
MRLLAPVENPILIKLFCPQMNANDRDSAIGLGERAILYRDEHLVAVDKPAGLLVHRSGIAHGAERFALQAVRDLLGRRVYTVHRLDRPVSGVLLLGLSPEAGRRLSALFEDRAIHKEYLGLVRGWPQPFGLIDHPLSDGPGQPARESLTRYRVLARSEVPVAVTRYPTSRYALVAIRPETGRFHQIRRHFHHACHPLIGDTTHGEGRHNRFFRDQLGVDRLLLHARTLCLPHPFTGERLRISAPLDDQWRRVLRRLSWTAASLR